MTRSRALLFSGLGVTLVIPAVLLWPRSHAAPRQDDPRVIALLPREEQPVIPRDEAAPVPKHEAAPAPAAKADKPSPVAVAPSPVTVPAVVVPAPTFEPMRVVEPVTSTEIAPVAFESLPEASPAPSEADDVPLYVPGSIGKAKRQWAGGDGALAQPGNHTGTIMVGRGGGHCPMPGRGGPIWKMCRTQ